MMCKENGEIYLSASKFKKYNYLLTKEKVLLYFTRDEERNIIIQEFIWVE